MAKKKFQLEEDSSTITRDREEVKHPRNYKVLLLNDDYTTMDFVVAILESIFKKSPAEAMQIMLAVHKRGHGVAGVFTKQIAEAKVELVHARAADEGYPLKCRIEEE